MGPSLRLGLGFALDEACVSRSYGLGYVLAGSVNPLSYDYHVRTSAWSELACQSEKAIFMPEKWAIPFKGKIWNLLS